jgi:hypothetical protein
MFVSVREVSSDAVAKKPTWSNDDCSRREQEWSDEASAE